MSRAPDVQRRLRHGPLLPHEEVRARWQSFAPIRALARDGVPLWAGDLLAAYLVAQLVWALV